MRVLMLGWEFPPFISGGLGTACYGLTRALSAEGVDVVFLLPRPVSPLPAMLEPAAEPPLAPPAGLTATGPPPNDAPFPWFRMEVAAPPAPDATASDVPHPALPPVPSAGNAAPAMRRDGPADFGRVSFRTVDAALQPYQSPAEYQRQVAEPKRSPRPAPAEGPSFIAVPMHAAVVPPASAAPAPSSAAAPAAERSPPGAALPPAPNAPSAPAEPESAKTPGYLRPPATANRYAGDLFAEVHRYAALAAEVARDEAIDVVHAHDWMTFPAGLAVAALKGVPLVAHVHSTEFDRSGLNVDQRIYDIERRGMHGAMKVVAVSGLTKNLCAKMYGVNPAKIEVVYNAIETPPAGEGAPATAAHAIHEGDRIVLFLGRITMQKGPEYFLAAAKRVLEVVDNVKFVMAGAGDMIRRTVELAAAMGIGHRVLFTGFLRGADVDRVFRMADLYVMPSVSEPFGIAPLEAMSHDVPVLISKQSGVSEVLRHALKVDFWDVNEMANKIIAVLKHPPLARTLREEGGAEVRQFSWADAAQKCVAVYEQAIRMLRRPPHSLSPVRRGEGRGEGRSAGERAG